MDITVDLTPIADFFNLPADIMLWRMLVLFGWVPIVAVFLYGAKEVWLFYIRNFKYAPTVKSILLAIDIPRGNEQSPKAVENIFTYLAGAHSTINLLETYWEGKVQLGFSFEIVSIEGYTQFIIRTPIQNRNLVESAIYSQYPDAEITEVDDYTANMPSTFPDEEYDIWGCDFIQKRHWVYPIKTYEEFEHSLGKEGVQFKDPMASLMDLCSSLIKGEQLWFQMIVRPMGFDWMEEGDKEIRKILGEKPKGTATNAAIDTFVKWMGDFSEFVYRLWGEIEEPKKEEKEELLKMMNMPPKEKSQIEGITLKISKVGFTVKPRFVYVARKEVFNKPKVVNGFIGYIKQFSQLNLNQIRPDMDLTATSVHYLFKQSRLLKRKNRIMTNFKKRDTGAGRTPFVLNTEELASIWHFPLESAVKAPMIQKTPGRKAEAPMSLPISEEIVSEEILEPLFEEESDIFKKDEIKKKESVNFGIEGEDAKKETISKGTPPPNLPFA
ncbi:MAG: hypothetical protein PHT51_05150 [Patescibacteria group bacterium]|nr:hypothetical protein [Patescibacteria group bacterium]MDD4610846.1 hypothetical protein [Patescibacteria group bacterium]